MAPVVADARIADLRLSTSDRGLVLSIDLIGVEATWIFASMYAFTLMSWRVSIQNRGGGRLS
jgi:hypothetical protein